MTYCGVLCYETLRPFRVLTCKTNDISKKNANIFAAMDVDFMKLALCRRASRRWFVVTPRDVSDHLQGNEPR